jgi:hypothetical protein
LLVFVMIGRRERTPATSSTLSTAGKPLTKRSTFGVPHGVVDPHQHADAG